jgi:transcriptional regulator with XRE-family HTH domain
MDAQALGKWIAARRAERSWSQMDLAIHLKTGTGNISRWERGIVEPNCAALRKICKVFGSSADDALGIARRAS